MCKVYWLHFSCGHWWYCMHSQCLASFYKRPSIGRPGFRPSCKASSGLYIHRQASCCDNIPKERRIAIEALIDQQLLPVVDGLAREIAVLPARHPELDGKLDTMGEVELKLAEARAKLSKQVSPPRAFRRCELRKWSCPPLKRSRGSLLRHEVLVEDVIV
ncbi:hypothetical protein Tdes44962_MAKER06769 [Teratosphaeria destructans]|uniref:Uncharacterized protein n=1 Tax=Teratosphaeria destructans TaxID=418781 RepID=A0A9W7W752_9PEZI|nr:hypothetical protein Tdes44962_MAKER06769 [Teratosphaeria destructans]